MRLINKYETSMEAWPLSVQDLELELEPAGGRAAKITQEINIQVGQANGVSQSTPSFNPNPKKPSIPEFS